MQTKCSKQLSLFEVKPFHQRK